MEDREIQVIVTTIISSKSGVVYRIENPKGDPSIKTILLTSETPDDLKTRAYAFNWSCLTKIGGCAELGDLLTGDFPLGNP